ncbi:unnamed protein product [Miscanthus lutarioriparius]|uniref:Uncharacterized protein n=1 Tax=Miscanthus lutarioriparius TaxID=422564 RepID=A0A811S6B1_9POAL|nr:unnamed protein product [Miscanthus lutarioriparius]
MASITKTASLLVLTLFVISAVILPTSVLAAALCSLTILRASGRAQFMGVPTFPFPGTVAGLVPPTLRHRFPH